MSAAPHPSAELDPERPMIRALRGLIDPPAPQPRRQAGMQEGIVDQPARLPPFRIDPARRIGRRRGSQIVSVDRVMVDELPAFMRVGPPRPSAGARASRGPCWSRRTG